MGATLALLIVKLAPQLLSLLDAAIGALHDKRQLDAGDARAVARALAAAARARGLAVQVEAEAARAHKVGSDAAFDREFQRKD
jgi:hypothetical protein